MENNIFNEDNVNLNDKLFFSSKSPLDKLQDKIDECVGDSISDDDQLYMLWFGKLCDDAGSKIGEDRQFLISTNVPEFSDGGELIGAHTEIITEPDLLPTIGGQVFSKKAATKIGKYLAKKMGKSLGDIEKELNES